MNLRRSWPTVVLFLTMMFSSCTPRLRDEYIQRYHYLGAVHASTRVRSQFDGRSDYFLVLLVDARHLDYSSPSNYFSTLGQGLFFSQDPNTGHAWIVLSGTEDGKEWVFEGGHTGEFGLYAPRYFDEVVRLSYEEHHPNPAHYLFTPLPDGSIQYGSGGHRPTFAAALPLTEEGYHRIRRLLLKDGYDFSQWGIRGPNCIRFVLSCLAAADIELDCQETLVMPQSFLYRGEEIRLWSDPTFSTITVETPELLEKRLWQLTEEGRALVAMQWYKKLCERCRKGEVSTAILPDFPIR